MPSGSRRKKASKKKKGNDSNNIKSSATLQSAENEDLTNQEERDSDGGENEAVSPVCEGNNQDQFPEAGSELEIREELPPVRSVASGNISLEGDTVDSKEVQIVGLDSEGNGILEKNVKEMKLEDAPESVSVNESVEVLTNGYLEERNGIDLNGEPKFDVESELVKPESAVLEAPESGDSVVDSLFTSFDKVIHDATDVALIENLIDSGSDLKENGEKELKPRDHSSEFGHNVLDVSSEVEEVVESVTDVPDRVVHVTEPAPNETILVSASDLKENKDKDLQTRDYSSQLSQTPLEISSTVDEYILSDSVPDVETCLEKVESIDLASEKVIHVSETAPVESMVDSGSVLMENGEEIVAPFESSIGFDEATISEKVIYVNGTAPTEKVNEGLHTGDCSAQTPDILLDMSSKVQESAAKVSIFSAKDEAREKDDRSLPISDSSTVCASSSVESSKEPESCEISENQTLIGTAPRHVEKSSWFGCCGIFDLISGTR